MAKYLFLVCGILVASSIAVLICYRPTPQCNSLVTVVILEGGEREPKSEPGIPGKGSDKVTAAATCLPLPHKVKMIRGLGNGD